jgi:broad specificity phosphatase PhoE
MVLIYYVRHGENKANVIRQFSYKKIDYLLNEKGIQQAEQTATYFEDKKITKIYSSPLKRAKQTAEIIGKRINLPITVLENFREINVGDFDGLLAPENWDQYDKIIDEWDKGHKEYPFPGGESYNDMLKRVKESYKQIIETSSEEDRIIVTAHGGIFVYLLGDFFTNTNIDVNKFRKEGIGNCSINIIEAKMLDGDLIAKLLEFNYNKHLSGDAALPVQHKIVEEPLQIAK